MALVYEIESLNVKFIFICILKLTTNKKIVNKWQN